MEVPPYSNNWVLMNVHGAGCQRSDFKDGDPNLYPYGHGPQGDVVRIFNLARLVRTVAPTATGLVGRKWGVPCGRGRISTLEVPDFSTPCPVDLTGAGAAGHALLIIGMDVTGWAGRPLPLDLAAYGAPGCLLYTDVLIGLTLPVRGGAARMVLNLPAYGQWLCRFPGWHMQYVYPDPGLPGGIGVTGVVSISRPGG